MRLDLMYVAFFMHFFLNQIEERRRRKSGTFHIILFQLGGLLFCFLTVLLLHSFVFVCLKRLSVSLNPTGVFRASFSQTIDSGLYHTTEQLKVKPPAPQQHGWSSARFRHRPLTVRSSLTPSTLYFSDAPSRLSYAVDLHCSSSVSSNSFVSPEG